MENARIPQYHRIQKREYYEIMIVTPGPPDSGFSVHVLNTAGGGTCCPEWWKNQDEAQILQLVKDNLPAFHDAVAVYKNGPRYWTMNGIVSSQASSTCQIGKFCGREVAQWQLPSVDWKIAPYTPLAIHRNTEFVYEAYHSIVYLRDPQKKKFVLQSRFVGPIPTSILGSLPPGWTIHAELLFEEVRVPSVGGVAVVVMDHEMNVYQRVDSPDLVSKL